MRACIHFLDDRRDLELPSPFHSPVHSNYFTSLAGAHSSNPFKMTHLLPPMLLNLFAPRPPLRWVEPADHAPEKRCTPKITGLGQYLEAMKEYKDNDGYVPSDSWLQKRDKKKVETKEKQEKQQNEVADLCTDPHTARALRSLTCEVALTNGLQTNPAKIPKSRATLSKLSSSPDLPTVSPLTISSANLVATVLSSVYVSSKTSLRLPTRLLRSASVATRSSSSSARKI